MHRSPKQIFACAAAIALILSVLPGCSLRAAEPANPVTENPTTVATDNSFGIDLYKKLSQTQKGNAFFSPYSIRTALAMTYIGARGHTAEQMATVLHFDSIPPEQLAAGFSSLIKSLNPSDGTYQLTTANALWGQSGFGFQNDFEKHLADDFQAPMHQVDFQKAPEPARLEINNWAAEQTKDKIKDLLAPRTVDESTRLILTNAIYFKSSWAQPFRPEGTKDEPFHIDASQKPTVPMMHRGTASLRYFDADQSQIVELPYVRGELSMVLIVPKAIDAISAVEKNLTAESLKKSLDAMDFKTVNVSMPKFKITGEFGLADTLKTMGMTDAFDQKTADFSGMATPEQMAVERLYINQVVHKAFVDVDEYGTEAAAATAVTMVGATAMMFNPPKPIIITADRPFLFLIRHRESGTILFFGRVTDPRN